MGELLAAAGFTDITPGAPLALAGAAAPPVYRTVADGLEANVLVLDDGERRVALVSLDTLYVGELRERVSARLAGALAPETLFMAASHTHFAPATDPWLSPMGAVDEGYLTVCAARVAELVLRLLGACRERCTLRYAEAQSQHAVNRRRRVLALHTRPLPHATYAMGMHPNPDGASDPVLRLLRVDGPAGEAPPRAILWSTACHPVMFPIRDAVSAEYPGVARAALRRRLGAAVPVLFLQGFTGNLRPHLVQSPPRGARALLAPLFGPRFAPKGTGRFHPWADALAEQVVALATAPGRSVAGPLVLSRNECPVSRLVPEDSSGRALSLHRVAFGRDLAIVGLSAEPMAEHVPLVQRLGGAACTIPVGYIDRVFGYLPTTAMLREGGYEVDGFRAPFALGGKIAGDPDRFLESRLAALGPRD